MRVKRRPLLALTRELLPHDRTFTISEVVELLSQGEPDRTVYSATVRTFFVRFEEQGLIHRVRRCKGRVLWATVDSGVPDCPYGALPKRTTPRGPRGRRHRKFSMCYFARYATIKTHDPIN
jgi:hypothetical protein